MTNQAFTSTKFSDFALDPKLISALDDAGFTNCTPIQELTIPHIIEKKDVAGQAQTGTGKTLAFLVGTFQQLLQAEKAGDKTDIRALILAPTRELAIQIHADAEKINEHLGFDLALAYGGVDYEKQRKTLEDGVDILIGTPGRIIDYFKQKVFSLGSIEVAVLDEADRMFDLGFIKDIRYVFNKMPPANERLSMLYSATLSHRVQELAYVHMNEPVDVLVEADTITADRVIQEMFLPSADEKIQLLIGLMRKHNPVRSMVFTNMKATAEEVHAWLEENGFSAALLSGDIPQRKRQRLLEEFKMGKKTVMVATDVAARGLHIDEVSHVFNYDLPNDAEDYVHRIGRTARAGSEGVAISFACDYSAINLPAIEEYIEQKIPKGQITDDDFAEDLTKPDYKKRSNRKDRISKVANDRSDRNAKTKKAPTRTKDAYRAKEGTEKRSQKPERNNDANQSIDDFSGYTKVRISRANNDKDLKIRVSKRPGEVSMRAAKNGLTAQNTSLRALHPATLKNLEQVTIQSKWDYYDTPVIG